MNRIIVNATEGGAKIKGTIQIPLCDFIKKYCQEPIDKSKLQPLLELADNGNELIEKVIPLLQDDIDNLDVIIKNSRAGIAASSGIKKLMNRKSYEKLMKKKTENVFEICLAEARKECENDFIAINHCFYEKLLKQINKPELRHIIKLSQYNFKHSEAAHLASIKNPLVNVAIYGASRAIQGRALKVNETLVNFLKDKKTAFTRMERNSLILNTAKKAAESLKKSYTETLELLKKYDETKDDKLLRPVNPEEINLDDAEDYFAVGNWAHPLLDSIRILKDLNHNEYKKAKKIYEKAISIREEAIKKAKQNENENLDHERKLIQYNELIEQAKDTGKKDKDFEKALSMLQQAIELLPDKIEGRWGLATALHHSGKIEEAIIEYKKLVDGFPDNARFKFEYGQALLINNQIQDGLHEIGKSMEMTNEFDPFLIRVGEIYEQTGMVEEALIAYENYLEKFPYDFSAWEKHGDCLIALGKESEAEDSYQKAKIIKPSS